MTSRCPLPRPHAGTSARISTSAHTFFGGHRWGRRFTGLRYQYSAPADPLPVSKVGKRPGEALRVGGSPLHLVLRTQYSVLRASRAIRFRVAPPSWRLSGGRLRPPLTRGECRQDAGATKPA